MIEKISHENLKFLQFLNLLKFFKINENNLNCLFFLFYKSFEIKQKKNSYYNFFYNLFSISKNKIENYLLNFKIKKELINNKIYYILSSNIYIRYTSLLLLFLS